jgi:predicted metal-dependent hydrolase
MTAVRPEQVRDFKQRVASWSARLGVQPRRVEVRQMKRKWASCSPRGRLCFAADLLGQPLAFQSDVIVHELLHLQVPNHGRLFSALLHAWLANEAGGSSPGSHLRAASSSARSSALTTRRIA